MEHYTSEFIVDDSFYIIDLSNMMFHIEPSQKGLSDSFGAPIDPSWGVYAELIGFDSEVVLIDENGIAHELSEERQESVLSDFMSKHESKICKKYMEEEC